MEVIFLNTIIEWFILNWTGLLAVMFTFGFMIFVHELGHFIVAKRSGITVHEFALGFGPKLLSFGGNKGDDKFEKNKDENSNSQDIKTEYNLRLIPLGGFVKMEGEDEPGDAEDPGNFNNKPVKNRLATVLAGCAMNYIAGILIFILIGFIWGVRTEAQIPAVIGTLTEGYPLQKAGLKPGDKIVKVNDTDIKDFEQLRTIISPMKEGQEVNLQVERNGEKLDYKVSVMSGGSGKEGETKRGMLGFSPKLSFLNFAFEKASADKVIITSLDTTWRLTIAPVTIVEWILAKKISGKEVVRGTAGPVGISQMLFEVSKKGIPSLLYICAMLSILIGAFNLLPIPALDGSRALFMIVEIIRGKPVDPEKEGMIHRLGFAVLLVLVFFVTVNDILRIIRGENLFK
jgi:regulator of sigma E protease